MTVREACELTGASDKTFQRGLNPKAGETSRFPNAYQDAANRKAWMIPVGDLVAAGLLDPTRVATIGEELAALRESATVRELREQVIRLEAELGAERRRCAELLADKAYQQRLLEALAGAAPKLAVA